MITRKGNPNHFNTRIQKKGAVLVTLVFSLLFSFSSFAQADSTYNEAKSRLIKVLKKRVIDKPFTDNIARFYGKTCDSLLKTNLVVDNRPIRVVLTRFFDATEQKLSSGFITLLRIPSTNNYFLQTLKTYKKYSIAQLYRQIGLTQSAILDFAFDGTALGDSITTIVGIREMLNAPVFISTRLSQPRNAMFRDTLLYYLANAQPELLTQKLGDLDSMLTALVSRSKNMTVQAVAQTQKDNFYDKSLPFGLAILENRITADEIKKLALEPSAYYKAFTDEVIRLHTSKNFETRTYLKDPISELNKKLSNSYYISEVNELHESPDKVRFKILNDRTPRELYFLLVGGTGELYTSSFLYIYKKFIKDTEKEGLEKFFTDVDYYQFDQFISNISGYGLVDDLVEHMQPATVAGLLGKSIARLSSSQLTDNEVILSSMTLSDVLYSIRENKSLKDLIVKQLDNLKNPKVATDILLQRIYNGLKGVLINKNEFSNQNSYDVLSVKRLQKNEKIIQACFFYDDDDGINSFANSTATYTANLWEKKDMGNYIVFNSKSGNNMLVYMNKPKTTVGSDTAQDEMLRDIRQSGYEPTSFIHRGHSYYLLQSLRKMTPSGQFVFLGSCGGYNEVLKLFQMNPDVNIIATRNIGSTLINDPMLQQINTDLVNNQDLVWDNLWKDFDAKFQSKHTKDLFSSYIPPNKYVGIKFIRKVFNF